MKRHSDCLRVALYAAKARKPFRVYSSIFEAAEKQGCLRQVCARFYRPAREQRTVFCGGI